MGMFSFLNPITQPFGFKLGGGGPYADAGQGDLAKKAATGPLPGLSDMGALGSLPQIYGQLAKMNGVQNPFDSMGTNSVPGGSPATNRQPGTGAGQTDPNANWDPYTLSPVNQRQLNNEQGNIAAAHKTALGRVQARLSARGMGDSSSMDAAQAYLQQAYGGQAAQAETQAGQHQFDSRQQMLTQFAQAIQQLFQDQMARANQKAGAYSQAGTNATNMTNSANADLGHTLGMIFGGMGGGAGGAAAGGGLGGNVGGGIGNFGNIFGVGQQLGSTPWGAIGP